MFKNITLSYQQRIAMDCPSYSILESDDRNCLKAWTVCPAAAAGEQDLLDLISFFLC